MHILYCSERSHCSNWTGVDESPFLIHLHASFGKTNKAVVNAMKRSIMVGVDKARRTIDYFTDEDECKILAFKGHLPITPTGVHKQFTASTAQ